MQNDAGEICQPYPLRIPVPLATQLLMPPEPVVDTGLPLHSLCPVIHLSHGPREANGHPYWCPSVPIWSEMNTGQSCAVPHLFPRALQNQPLLSGCGPSRMLPSWSSRGCSDLSSPSLFSRAGVASCGHFLMHCGCMNCTMDGTTDRAMDRATEHGQNHRQPQREPCSEPRTESWTELLG